MTLYHDNRGERDPAPTRLAAPIGKDVVFPEAKVLVHVLGSDFVNLRFSNRIIDGRPRVTSLQVEAVHPKVQGDKRVFDLSFVLEQISSAHPTTVAQIVDPHLSMEARLDALKIAVLNIARVTLPLLPLNEPRYGSGHSPSADGLEPSFSVRHVVLTHFSDLLQGYSRRGVTVVRNAEPWIQFHIIEGRSGLSDASLVVLPTGVELPLLDRTGSAVTEGSLNETIHDFTHLLLKGRYEPELKVLDSLASELTHRLNRNPDAPDTLKKRNFGHEIILAARDGLLWSQSGEASAAHAGKLPAELHFEARGLPDGRVLWIRHQCRRISSEVSLVMDSLEGGQCTISFHYPPHAHAKVARVAKKLSLGTTWPVFQEITDLLFAVPRSGLSLMFPTSTDSYPAQVNGLIKEVARVASGVHLERGLLREGFERFDGYLPDFVSELVKGRSPFMATIASESPADMWWVQGFLDRDLRGSVFAVNALGGSIVVSDPQALLSTDTHRGRLVKFFKTLVNDPARLTQNLNYSTGMRESRCNLPEKSWRDAFAYSTLVSVIEEVWEALVLEKCVSRSESAGWCRWHTKRLEDGVWSVSLLPRNRDRLPYLINFKVAQEGVREIAYSYGRRGPLGSLLGRRIWMDGGGVIGSEYLDPTVRAIARSASGTLGHSVRYALSHISPGLEFSLLPLASLRECDPDHKRHDLLARLWNACKGIW